VSERLWPRRRGDPGGEVGCVGCGEPHHYDV
jgi:hypothetical protein